MAEMVFGMDRLGRAGLRPAKVARLFVAALTVLVVGSLTLGCGGGGEDSARSSQEESLPVASVPDSISAETVRDEPGGSVLEESAGIPVLLDLGAGKCVPCKMMAPILDEMRVTFAGRLDVRFIDVWKDATAARQYGVKVIPTQIFFDEKGNELFRHQGFLSREDMLAKWAELGYQFEG